MSDIGTEAKPAPAEGITRSKAGSSQGSLDAPRGAFKRRRLILLLSLCALCLLAIGLGSVSAFRYVQSRRLAQEAQRASEQGDLRQAQELLNQSLELWPDSARVHFLAARTARRLSLYDEAENHLYRAQQLGWDAEAINLEHRLSRAQRGDLRGVEEPLLDAVDRNSPNSTFILEALCQGYMEKDSQSPRVLRCLNLWLERNPRAIRALIWRGDLRYSSQDSTGAISDYKRALEIAPENDDTHLHLAVVLYISHAPSEAAEHYQRVLTRQTDNDAALFGLALCCRDLDQPNRACQLLDTLLHLQPEHAAAARERGNLALSAGQLSLAEHWLRQAVRLDRDDKIANLLLYRCLTRLISRPAVFIDPWAWLHRLMIQIEADAYRARYLHLSGKKRG